MIKCEGCKSTNIKYAVSETVVKQYNILPDGTIDKNEPFKEHTSLSEHYALCGRCGKKLAVSTKGDKVASVWERSYYR